MSATKIGDKSKNTRNNNYLSYKERERYGTLSYFFVLSIDRFLDNFV